MQFSLIAMLDPSTVSTIGGGKKSREYSGIQLHYYLVHLYMLMVKKIFMLFISKI